MLQEEEENGDRRRATMMRGASPKPSASETLCICQVLA